MWDGYLQRCDNFIAGRDISAGSMRFEYSALHCLCSLIHAARNREVDAKRVVFCRGLVRRNISVFSSFRGTFELAIEAALAAGEGPEAWLERAYALYRSMRQHKLPASEYLAWACLVVERKPGEHEQLVERSVFLYRSIKKQHPFITGAADVAYAVFMAATGRDTGELLEEAELIYRELYGKVPFASAAQSLSHVLTLIPGQGQEKAARLVELTNRLKERKVGYGTVNELPSLGVFALADCGAEKIADDIFEVSCALKKYSKMGSLSVGRSQRALYAAIIVAQQLLEPDKAVYATDIMAVSQMAVIETSALIATS